MKVSAFNVATVATSDKTSWACSCFYLNSAEGIGFLHMKLWNLKLIFDPKYIVIIQTCSEELDLNVSEDLYNQVLTKILRRAFDK